MPYAPTVERSRGPAIAQGISNGLDAILQGMEQKAAERRQKEKDKQMEATLGPIIEKLSGGAIKLKDAPPESWPLLWQAAQQEQQRPLRELQQRNAELENVLRSLEVGRARGRAAREDEMAALDTELRRLEVQAAKTPREAFRPELVPIGNGRYAMTTSEKSAIPYDIDGDGAAKAGSPLGQLLADVRAAESRGDTEGAKLLLEGARTAAAGGRAPQMDEVTMLQWRGFAQRAEEIKQKIAEHQQQQQTGDKRTGFLNMGSRQSAIDALLKELATVEMQKRLLLQTPQGSMAAPPDPLTPALPAAAPAGAPVTSQGVLDPDEFFSGL